MIPAFEKILEDNGLKSKAKAEQISRLLVHGEVTISDLVSAAKHSSDVHKGTLMESLEFATKKDPTVATLEAFKFASASLSETAPRIKLESARVIGNIAHLYAGKADLAITHLLSNSEHPGTVVRWGTAFALGQIMRTRHPKTAKLIPAVKALEQVEKDNAIRKIYQKALKDVEK